MCGWQLWFCSSFPRCSAVYLHSACLGGIVPCDSMHVSRLGETAHKNSVHLLLLLIKERKADAWQGPHALQCVTERHTAVSLLSRCSTLPVRHPLRAAVSCVLLASCSCLWISELLPSLLNLLSHLSQPYAASRQQAGAANPLCGVMKSLLPSCKRQHLAPMCGRCGDGGPARPQIGQR